MIECNKCGKFKDKDSFRINVIKGKDYRRKGCRSCEVVYNSKRVKSFTGEKKEKHLKAKRDSYTRNIETRNRYKKENCKKIKEYDKNYKKNNRAKCTSLENKRRAAKLKATPVWLNKKMLADIEVKYVEANKKSCENIKYSVDHIVPLQGKNVCGLHVSWNLQILTIEDNSKKGNRY
jgi:hypothetical protein